MVPGAQTPKRTVQATPPGKQLRPAEVQARGRASRGATEEREDQCQGVANRSLHHPSPEKALEMRLPIRAGWDPGGSEGRTKRLAEARHGGSKWEDLLRPGVQDQPGQHS